MILGQGIHSGAQKGTALGASGRLCMPPKQPSLESIVFVSISGYGIWVWALELEPDGPWSWNPYKL